MHARIHDLTRRRTAEERALLKRQLSRVYQSFVSRVAEARGRSYFVVLTADGLDHWGRYKDRYRCVDGRWLFQERTVTLDGAVEGGWAQRGGNGPGRASSRA